MKKMNNKGFAVSTLLYSLSIMGFLIVSVMVSIMSLNRINTKSLVKQIEDELNRYSLTETTFRADETNTVTGQEFIVPRGEAGYYKIELWGAQGGDKGSKKGGRGAYTSGTIFLDENEKLYFYIGKKPTGTNGGANGGSDGNSTYAAGGGSTDVRLIEDGGLAIDNSSEYTRIMVAAGGGGGSTNRKGGEGGTLTGIKYYNQPQIAGKATQKIAGDSMFFSSSKAGAGGGYTAGAEGEGGSSYIAGYAGVNSLERTDPSATAEDQPKQTGKTHYTFWAKEHPDSTEYKKIREYYFYNALMLHSVQDGDGYATIRKVASATKKEALENKTKIPPVKTNYLNNIATITDCAKKIVSKQEKDDKTGVKDEKITSTKIKWPEIQLINSEGKNILKGVTPTANTAAGITDTNKLKLITDGDLTTYAESVETDEVKCITIAVPTNNKNIELSVYHQPGEIENHSLSVTYTDGRAVKDILGDRTYTNSGDHEAYVTGEHISSYSPEHGNNTIPTGNYYLIPVSQRSMVVTTYAQSETFGQGTDIHDTTQLKVTKITGSNYQKWYFESLGDGTYRIVESQDKKALQIASGLYRTDEVVSAPYQFIGNPEEKWKFKFDGKGRTQIYSTNGSSTAYLRHLNDQSRIVIDAGSVRDTSDYPNFRTYFYLINAEY